MKIKRLHLENYRIHQDSVLSPGDNSFVIVRGRNFAGKSTIGQALSMCLTPTTTGLDAKGTGYASKIKRGASKAVITAQIQTKHYLIQRTVTLNTNSAGRTASSICLNEPDWNTMPFDRKLEQQRVPLMVALNTDTFLRMDEKEQKNLLAALALPSRYEFPQQVIADVETVLEPGTINFAGEPFEAINVAYKNLYNERQIVNRQVREFAIPERLTAPAGVDSHTLNDRLTSLRVRRREQVQQHDREVNEAMKVEGERQRIEGIRQSLLPDDKLAYLRKVAAGKEELDKLLKDKRYWELEIDEIMRQLARLEEIPDAGTNCPTCDQVIDPQRITDMVGKLEAEMRQAKEQNNLLFQKIGALGGVDEAVKQIAKHEAAKKELQGIENPQPVLFDFAPYNQSIGEIDAEIENLSGQLRPVIAAEERYKEIDIRKKQLVALKEKAAMLDNLVKYFDKDGIKAQLLGQYVGGFENKINEVMKAWGYRCSLLIEPYQFDITNARGDAIPVRELSGAERVMFSLAFQCAVSWTAGIGLVVIDEVAMFLPELRPILNKKLWEMIQQGYLEQVILLIADTSETVPKLPGIAIFMVNDGAVAQLNAMVAA